MIFSLIISFVLFFNYGSTVAQISSTEDLVSELNNNPIDPNSFSRPDLCRVTHIQWKAFVNFKEQIIEGTVDLTVEKQNNSTNEVFLDTSGLSISEVKDRDTKEKLKYELSPAVKIFGSKLTIKLLPKNKSIISITYKTSTEASALAWLKPEQTAGKRKPYVFSQCEALHCRSLLPLQDTPSVKSPYEATVSFYISYDTFQCISDQQLNH